MKTSIEVIRGIENLGNNHPLMGRNIPEKQTSEEPQILIITVSSHNMFAIYTCIIPDKLKHAKLFHIGNEAVV
jgi:hypothetical protein